MHDQQTLILRVEPAHAGERLDSYLAARIEGWSRARLQQLIESEDVLLNGRPSKPSQKLHANDELEVELTPAPVEEFAPENIPLEIIHEDSDLVVVNKPAGLVTHPAAGVPGGALANALAFHFQQLSERAGPRRPGIVHRLDKDTSGLLVVAKNEASHENLADQFRAREVFKSYVALVHGNVAQDTGRIDQPIGRDPKNRTRMAVVLAGRSALTIYRVKRRYDSMTLLDIELKTGRTHQIRVHLSWMKHPVVGDEVYGSGRDNSVRDPEIRAGIRKLARHFLHAERLAFRHPTTGTIMEFQAPLPDDLARLIAALEARANR